MNRYHSPRYQLLPSVGICVIDFTTLFLTRIRTPLFEHLDQLEIKYLDKLNTTAKRVIKHYVIHYVCERIRKANAYGNLKTAIYVNREEFEGNSNLPSVYFERVVLHALSDIDSKLPIRIYFAKYSYDDFVNPNISTGVVKEVKAELSKLVEKDFSSFTFEKIKKFTEKEGLTYLNKDYFQNLKSKLIISV